MTEDKTAGITLKQVNFIKTLCGRNGCNEPNYDAMSMNDAKKMISNFLENAGETPKEEVNPPTLQEIEVIKNTTDDLLRQILAELKEMNKTA